MEYRVPLKYNSIKIWGEKSSPKTLWNFRIVFSPSNKNVSMKKKFIRKPTRKSNILDLVFCNNPYLISDYKIIINSKISDHSTIRIDMAYQSKDNLKPRKVNIASTKLPVYDFMNADEEDWLRLNVILSKIDWRTLFNGLNAEEMLNIFL